MTESELNLEPSFMRDLPPAVLTEPCELLAVLVVYLDDLDRSRLPMTVSIDLRSLPTNHWKAKTIIERLTSNIHSPAVSIYGNFPPALPHHNLELRTSNMEGCQPVFEGFPSIPPSCRFKARGGCCMLMSGDPPFPGMNVAVALIRACLNRAAAYE